MSQNSEYYEQNKEKIKARSKEFSVRRRELTRGYKQKYKKSQRLKNRELVNSLKTECVHCGEKRKECLDFHHIGEKRRLIAKMLCDAYSTKTLLAEIGQCEVSCGNCHRKIHTTSNNPYNNKKGQFVREYKKTHCCSVCSESFWASLDFHHLRDKILNIGAMIRNKTYTLDDIKLEIDKCILLCVNCHRVEHSPEYKYNQPTSQ